jgi:hypothetical protein
MAWSPAEFERHAGMGGSRKWRNSIKIILPDKKRMSIGTWLVHYEQQRMQQRVAQQQQQLLHSQQQQEQLGEGADSDDQQQQQQQLLAFSEVSGTGWQDMNSMLGAPDTAMLNSGFQQQQQQQFAYQQPLPSLSTLPALPGPGHMEAAAGTAAAAAAGGGGGGAACNIDLMPGLSCVAGLPNSNSSTPAEASMAQQLQAQQAALWGQLQMDGGAPAHAVLPVGPGAGPPMCAGAGGSEGEGLGVPHPGAVASGAWSDGQGGVRWLQSSVGFEGPQWGADSGFGGLGDGCAGVGGRALCRRKRPAHVAFAYADDDAFLTGNPVGW